MVLSICKRMKTLTLLSLSLLMAFNLLSHNKRSSLEFVENQNQWHENVRFRAGLPSGASVYLEKDGFTFAFLDVEEFSKLHDLQFATPEEQQAFSVLGHAWKLNLLNSSLASVKGEKKMPYYYNYMLGTDPSNWSSNVGVYEMVSYSSVYEGIDLKVYSKKENLKYDFIVQSGADPSQIKFDYSGLEKYSIKDGRLVLETSIGTYFESKPFAYQLMDGKLVEVACNYKIEKGEVSYEFPNGFEKDLDLIIDPELIAATLSGTTGASNFGHCAAFDLEGNIFTGCVAGGSEYPVTTGAFQQTYGGGTWDVGISKLNPNGSDLIWATYIGGQNADYPHSIVTNNAGELYVYGSTQSEDYPVNGDAVQSTFGGETDIIVSHLSFDGTDLIGSTYLGGTGNDGQNANSANYGDNYRGEIIVDFDDNPIITSGSRSEDFPVLADAYQTTNAGLQDAVVIKLTPELNSLLVSTYYGGPNNEMGYGIRTAPDGSIFIGGSAGENLPLTGDSYSTEFIGEADGGGFGENELDAFIAKFNSSGVLDVATYYATESKDQIFFIDLDFDENVWVFGQGGPDMPITENVYVNENSGQFITKFSNDLSEVLVSTTVGTGGDGTDFVPDAFLVDNCDNIYISAYNAFGSLETTEDALFETGGFYLAVYEENLEDIVFGTFYTENHVDGGTSRFDKNGIVYQGVCSGGGFSTTDDAWATDQATGWDIGIFKIDFDASGVNAAVAQNGLTGCAPAEITFDNFSVGEEFEWDFGNGDTSTEFEPSVLYEEEGIYEVSLIARDPLSCNIADTLNLDIIISSGEPVTADFGITQTDCETLTVQTDNLSDGAGVNYIWDMGDGNTLTTENVSYDYEDIGEYTVTLTVIDELCNSTDTSTEQVVVSENVTATFSSNELIGCVPLAIDFSSNGINGSNSTWTFGDGSGAVNGDEVSYIFSQPGTYDVTLTVEVEGEGSCSGIDQTTTTVEVLAFPEVELGESGRFCQDSIFLSAVNSGVSYEWQDGSISESYTVFESGIYYVEAGNGYCSATDTIEIDLAPGLGYIEGLIPNVFSPNGDDYNERFQVDYNLPLNGTMQIYNRWGALIYEDSGNFMNWNGKIEGVEASQGVYFYIINVNPRCSEVPETEISGSVTLMR